MKTLAFSALAILLATGCNMDCIEGSGPVEERTIEVASFTGIELGGSMQVTMEKGPVQTITVSAQPVLLDLLNTEVKGDVWHIRTSKCWSSDQEFTVHITTPSLIKSIELHGSGDVRSSDVFSSDAVELSTQGSSTISADGLNTKKLDLAISGSGAITLRGTSANLEAELSGSGDLNAQDLTANAVDLGVSGSGSATITAISTLKANVSGSGTVRYGGKPNVNSSISGSGSVSPLP